MFDTLKKTITRSLLPALLMAMALNVSADTTFVQGGHSGGWIDVQQPNNGMFVEVISSETSPTGFAVVIAWYAFIDGHPTWIVGIGNVEQVGVDQIAKISAFVYEGNDFPPMYIPSQTLEIPWGVITLAFIGCDKALLTYNSTVSGYGSGEMDLIRITTIAQSTCDPELGENGTNLDDHGDFWQTGTSFDHKNLPLQSKNISAKLETNGDVDVFLITVFRNSDVTIFTQGTTDTMGTLYLLEEGIETMVATDDNSGVPDNFSIDERLAPGTYSVHVEASELLITETGQYLLTVTISQ
jgi:hypothetical protein